MKLNNSIKITWCLYIKQEEYSWKRKGTYQSETSKATLPLHKWEIKHSSTAAFSDYLLTELPAHQRLRELFVPSPSLRWRTGHLQNRECSGQKNYRKVELCSLGFFAGKRCLTLPWSSDLHLPYYSYPAYSSELSIGSDHWVLHRVSLHAELKSQKNKQDGNSGRSAKGLQSTVEDPGEKKKKKRKDISSKKHQKEANMQRREGKREDRVGEKEVRK